MKCYFCKASNSNIKQNIYIDFEKFFACSLCIFNRYNEYSINGKITLLEDLEYYSFKKKIWIEDKVNDDFKLEIVDSMVYIDDLKLNFFQKYIHNKYIPYKCISCSKNSKNSDLKYPIAFQINNFKMKLENYYICYKCLFHNYFNSIYNDNEELVLYDLYKESFILDINFIKNRFYEIYINSNRPTHREITYPNNDITKNIINPYIIHFSIRNSYVRDSELELEIHKKESIFKKCRYLPEDLIEEIIKFFRGLLLLDVIKSQRYLDRDNFDPISSDNGYIKCNSCKCYNLSNELYQVCGYIKTRGEYYIETISNICVDCNKNNKFIVIGNELYVQINKKLFTIVKVPDKIINYSQDANNHWVLTNE